MVIVNCKVCVVVVVCNCVGVMSVLFLSAKIVVFILKIAPRNENTNILTLFGTVNFYSALV